MVWYCDTNIDKDMDLPPERHYMREFLILNAERDGSDRGYNFTEAG